jgi:hypothetical protein
MRKVILSIIICFSVLFAFSQTHHIDSHREDESHRSFPHFRVAALIGHTLIPEEHAGKNFVIPSWGLDLEYWFGPYWGLGLHNDLEIETFVILNGAEGDLERRYPLVTTLDLLYKPWKGLVLQFGPGIEFEPSENFALLRVGIEYEFELTHHWDIAPTFFYDTRLSEYQTWSLALGVGKRF